MTTPLQSHDHAGALQRMDWCVDLAEATITTVTDAAFVGQVGRGVRPLSADVPGPGAPPPQGSSREGRPRRHPAGGRRRARG
jgi:hypothetical protein